MHICAYVHMCICAYVHMYYIAIMPRLSSAFLHFLDFLAYFLFSQAKKGRLRKKRLRKSGCIKAYKKADAKKDACAERRRRLGLVLNDAANATSVLKGARRL